jgi:hypothetical protein
MRLFDVRDRRFGRDAVAEVEDQPAIALARHPCQRPNALPDGRGDF